MIIFFFNFGKDLQDNSDKSLPTNFVSLLSYYAKCISVQFLCLVFSNSHVKCFQVSFCFYLYTNLRYAFYRKLSYRISNSLVSKYSFTVRYTIFYVYCPRWLIILISNLIYLYCVRSEANLKIRKLWKLCFINIYCPLHYLTKFLSDNTYMKK